MHGGTGGGGLSDIYDAPVHRKGVSALADHAHQPFPEFVLKHSGNVTAALGKTALLNCRVSNVGNKTVRAQPPPPFDPPPSSFSGYSPYKFENTVAIVIFLIALCRQNSKPASKTVQQHKLLREAEKSFSLKVDWKFIWVDEIRGPGPGGAPQYLQILYIVQCV